MLSLIITWILSNKELLGIGAVISTIIAIYAKGYFSGKSAVQSDIQKAVDEMAKQIAKTEATNQNIEAQKEKDANAVDNSSNVADLISLWNRLQKTDGSSPKEKP